MYIKKSIKSTLKQTGKPLAKASLLIFMILPVILGLSFAVQNSSSGSNIVSAATPPDNCFAFSSGTITSYYLYEGNNSVNPACPKEVEIPASIGGSNVTAIGDEAFRFKGLTSVVLPEGVQTIGRLAFFNNSISSLTLPNSLTFIDE